MDFTTPAPGGADGKAIHLVALEDIPDLSILECKPMLMVKQFLTTQLMEEI